MAHEHLFVCFVCLFFFVTDVKLEHWKTGIIIKADCNAFSHHWEPLYLTRWAFDIESKIPLHLL